MKGHTMILLHIEHTVRDFDTWKAAFDSDPVNRQKSGVRSYRILKPVDNPAYAIIDLEFETLIQAEALLTAMQGIWLRGGGVLVRDPVWRISEVIETCAY
jgi:hypothetical protein